MCSCFNMPQCCVLYLVCLVLSNKILKAFSNEWMMTHFIRFLSPHGNSFGNWQQFSLFNQISYSKRISTPSIHLNIPFSPSLLSQIGGMQPSLSDKDHPACRLSPGQPAVPPDCSHSAQPLWTHSWQATVLNDRLWCHSNLCNSVMSLYYTVGRGGRQLSDEYGCSFCCLSLQCHSINNSGMCVSLCFHHA